MEGRYPPAASLRGSVRNRPSVRPSMFGCLHSCLCRVLLLLGIASFLVGCSGTAVTRLADRHVACRNGNCEPHCPVRPDEFGYYSTHWRKWPTSDATGQTRPGAVTPAAPLKSAIPEADEDSPRGNDPELPPLAADAAAAAAGTELQRIAFTQQLVVMLLSEADPQIRARIVVVAAQFATPAADAICRGAVQDPDPLVRAAACAVWARRGGADALPLIAERFQADQEIAVRLRAVRALGELGDRAAIPLLVRALDDPNPAVQDRAVTALKLVSGRDLGNDPARWRAWAANPDGRTDRWSILEPFRRIF